MDIDVNADRELEISKIYNLIILKAELEEVSVCERDGRIEITPIRAQGRMKAGKNKPTQTQINDISLLRENKHWWDRVEKRFRDRLTEE